MKASTLLPVAAAASYVRAAPYSLNGPLASLQTPFPDAFVSYSIEFSSFPDFAGEYPYLVVVESPTPVP